MQTRTAIALASVVTMVMAAAPALGADPVNGPGNSAGRHVQLVKLRPLTVRVSGFKPGLRLVIRVIPTSAERHLAMEADGSMLVMFAIDAGSCKRRITSIVVTDQAGTRLASVRVPVPGCASSD